MPNENMILLHGAVNSSNFGDCLFVELFFDYLKRRGAVPVFLEGKYGISDFNRSAIGYTEKIDEDTLRSVKSLVYISGGYFGDGDDPIWMSWRRFFRYFRIAKRFFGNDKQIIISGVGGGTIKSHFTKRAIDEVVKKAEVVTVRDEGTRDYYQASTNKPISVTSDTALLLRRENVPPLEQAARNAILSSQKADKYAVLHLTGIREYDDLIWDNVAPALAEYLRDDQGCCVVVAYDCVIRPENVFPEDKSSIFTNPTYRYDYCSPMQLCALLSEAAFVVTAKLHVGIVSSALGNCVVSFPLHPYKTKRFYDSINEDERYMPLRDVDEARALSHIERFAVAPVVVPEEKRALAKRNLEICDCLFDF